jgi:4-amino-4-deoxy-L-arabinose transferase-like glycosyltransferase
MKCIKRICNSPIVWFLPLTVIYFIIRLTNLTFLPIFTDEAIYIRWSQIGANDAAWRFISLTDGKQPFFTWLVMAALRVFSDPLFAGRFVSVIGGFVCMTGMYFLGKEMFGKKSIGIIASILYLISPFALMYDRMALYDSWVAAFSVWNLYIAVLLVRRVRLDTALIFGLTLGAGMLNKTSAFLSLYLLPVTLVLFDWKKDMRLKRLGTWLGLCILAAILSQVIYSVLRLSPFFYIIAQKDTLFVYPLREWVTHPFRFLQGNFHGLFEWLVNYLTYPVCIAAAAAFLLKFKNIREKLLLIVWWLAPFVGLALFGKVLYPRFILFMAMPLLIMAAYTLDWIICSVKAPVIKYLLLSVLCIQSCVISYQVIFHITSAKIPGPDIGQYIGDWPSGWGTTEVADFLKKESESGPVAVYTEGTFGLFPYALEIYLNGNKNVEIHGLWPMTTSIPEAVQASAKVKPTYYVTNLTQTQPDWPLTLLAKYQKGNNPESSMRLYKVLLQKEK